MHLFLSVKFVLSNQDADAEGWRKNDPFSILYICESPKTNKKTVLNRSVCAIIIMVQKNPFFFLI